MLLKTTLIKPCLLKQKSYHYYADYQSIVRAYEDRSMQFGMWYLLSSSHGSSRPPCQDSIPFKCEPSLWTHGGVGRGLPMIGRSHKPKGAVGSLLGVPTVSLILPPMPSMAWPNI